MRAFIHRTFCLHNVFTFKWADIILSISFSIRFQFHNQSHFLSYFALNASFSSLYLIKFIEKNFIHCTQYSFNKIWEFIWKIEFLFSSFLVWWEWSTGNKNQWQIYNLGFFFVHCCVHWLIVREIVSKRILFYGFLRKI